MIPLGLGDGPGGVDHGQHQARRVKVLVGTLEDDPEDAAFTTRVIEAILAGHVAAA
jgi:hypothetical protein